MSINFGTVAPGSTLYIPFATYGNATPASITMSDFAVTDIEIYKNGGTTQRASDNGYTLLDTDGTNFDGITGVHGFSVSLADNSDAGFYGCGGKYFIVVSAVTVDGNSLSFIAALFEIGFAAAALNTTIATLTGQRFFTLTDGPAEDDALNGCLCYLHDVASAVQFGWAMIADYTGSTKSVTLSAFPGYTIAEPDNVSVFLPALPPMLYNNTQFWAPVAP